MCTGLEIAALVGAAASAAGAIDAHEKGRSAANKAKDAAAEQEQQFNKLNGKRPDISGMMSTNAMDAKSGPSGTLLTGPEGVDPNRLLLGKSTLLGG